MFAPHALSVATQIALERVDKARALWFDHVGGLDPEIAQAKRAKTLRRHAIETGIIEGLYDITYGETEALVDRGLQIQFFERQDQGSKSALETIENQFDALLFITSVVRDRLPFSTSFIRQLHSAITLSQATYPATDPFGGTVEAPLDGGVWKKSPNHVNRADGSRHEFTPPEFVQDEIDRLVKNYNDASADWHPVTLAAWVHHMFISIHPFPDGNGRVARALSLLVLLEHNYAPIVVSRFEREEYVLALKQADEGDLEPLIILFASLEENALRSELDSTEEFAGTAIDIAVAHAAMLQDSRSRRESEISFSSAVLATQIQEIVISFLGETRSKLTDIYRREPNTKIYVDHSAPPADESRYYKYQITKVARRLSFYANLEGGSWWTKFKLDLDGRLFLYLVFIQKVGNGETGWLALTVYAEAILNSGVETDDIERTPIELLASSSRHSLNFAVPDQLQNRKVEIRDLIETTFSASFADFINLAGRA